MRLIDADALIDEIKYITGQDTIMWFDDRKIKRGQEVNMGAFIECMPTIDPVKRGKWLVKKDTPSGELYTVCSVCETEIQWRNRHGLLLRVDMENAKYCPNCGALMDERSEE